MQLRLVQEAINNRLHLQYLSVYKQKVEYNRSFEINPLLFPLTSMAGHLPKLIIQESMVSGFPLANRRATRKLGLLREQDL